MEYNDFPGFSIVYMGKFSLLNLHSRVRVFIPFILVCVKGGGGQHSRMQRRGLKVRNSLCEDWRNQKNHGEGN